ncbi:aldehyde dehydrogenase family protein [Alicyclobacillus sp. SO9]|uniref:aldehyde dehydrogenase family protein n=1 Tax=Alicyclobacillus sp. SO9 TaxID=2665646 RepID=UPI0018E79A77|nr:aldehyde dehydrogenase family protein [Alicyclobacillus sp. SO9]QQE77727.1 aldehyde dehydrogenase family protein [Alicyclobacillus sp. SO9]
MLDFKSLGKQYIGGEWRDGSSDTTYADKNPFDESTVAEIRLASVADIDEAYQSAKKAQVEWARINAFEKRDVLERAAQVLDSYTEDIARLMAEEIGGTFLKAMVEVSLVKNFIREAASYPLRMEGRIIPATIPGKENRLFQLPAGVVGVISPFNFPMVLSARAVAPALGAGNGVVLKPHEAAGVTGGLILAKVFEEAGLPKGLFNVVIADIKEIGDAFVEHPIPSVISFTGSTPVGRHIGEVASRNLKRVGLELGGNSALIVLDDADVELAVNATAFSRFTHQGQICMCTNRAIVHRDVYPRFLDLLVAKASSLKSGDPREQDTLIGPLINHNQVEKLMSFVEESVKQGAKIAYQGEVKGNVVEPIVLSDVTETMSCAQVEMFGPVIAVMPVESEEEAIRVANNSDYGLSGAVFTRNLERGVEVAKQIETGMIHVNDGTVNDEPLVAFGGEKGSGVGRYNGPWALEEFTTTKWISVQYEPRQYPF